MFTSNSKDVSLLFSLGFKFIFLKEIQTLDWKTLNDV